MALTQTAQLQTISDALGAADLYLQTGLDTGTSSSTAAKVAVAREVVRTQMTASDVDDATTLLTAFRSVEKTLPSSLDAALNSAVRGIDTYYVAQTGNKMRVQFKTGVTWSEDFRGLWRRVMKEELIVRLGSITNTSGTWGSFTADKTITLDTALEIRTKSTGAIGGSPIVVTVIVSKTSGANETFTINVPAGTAAATAFAIGTTGKYNGVVSLACTGGSTTDVLEVWTK